MTEDKEEKTRAESAGILETLARLLDLGLSEPKKVRQGSERWPVLAALAFIFGSSLLIWALIIALVYYLL